MISRSRAMLLALGVFLPTLAMAQVPSQPPRAANVEAMYEDIEIMRRLLNAKLKTFQHSPSDHWTYPVSTFGTSLTPFGANYGPHWNTSMWAQPSTGLGSSTFLTPFATNTFGSSTQPYSTWQWSTPHYRVSESSPVEGVYLKGQGVVFTVTLPPSSKDPKPQAAKPAPKPMDDWERIRRELRGEKAEWKQAKAEPQAPSVADVILEMLAKNGHRFSQLGDNDSLTVVVTFRGNPSGHIYWKTSSADPGGEGSPASGSGEDPNGGKSDPKSPSTTPGGEDASKATSARDYELLGDLHLKQGQAKEALAAYEKAAEKDPQHAPAIYLKMANIYLTVNKDETRARQLMERAKELLDKASATYTKSAPDPTAKQSQLPAKLLISAPKKLLDQVGSGKISFEDFKKSASVQHLTFPGDGTLKVTK